MEVKKYFCKAGVKGMQVGLTSGPFSRVFALSVMDSGDGGALGLTEAWEVCEDPGH